MSMKLLLVDDHPLFGVGFTHALTHARDDIAVQTALTIEEGLELAGSSDELDAVLIDYRLSGDDGLEGLRRFGARHPLVARVLISGDEDPLLIVRARNAEPGREMLPTEAGEHNAKGQLLRRLSRVFPRVPSDAFGPLGPRYLGLIVLGE